jgi:energy-coupling factor transport system permease protein
MPSNAAAHAPVARPARAASPAAEWLRPGLAPRAWLIWSLAAVTVALSTNNPIYRGLVALAALDVLLTWLPEGRRVKPLGITVLVAAGFAALINVLAAHAGADVLARLPADWPLVGGSLTLETLAFGADLGLGLAAALLAVAPLSFVLEPHDVVDAMPGPLERTGIAVATSLNLVSGFGRTFGAVRDAQRMRGWRPRGLRSWNEVLVPVVLTAIEDSVLLAEAMESRGFGAGRRTSYSGSGWHGRDVAIALTAGGAAALFIGLRFAGVQIDWYPYPTIYLPPINPALLVGCLLLAVPALARPARPGLGR